MTYDQTTDLCQRQNLGMAWTVETAIHIGNPAEAAKYLRACGVPFDVAHRVLLRPRLRRSFKA